MNRPNGRVLVTDHQRADTFLPEYGVRTPNVDKLAAGGVTPWARE